MKFLLLILKFSQNECHRILGSRKSASEKESVISPNSVYIFIMVQLDDWSESSPK